MALSSLVLADWRGGRNGVDAPTDPTFPDDQVAEALNVDFYGAPLGRKRGGATTLALTGGTAPTAPIHALFRHVPSDDETLAELWSVDERSGNPDVKRLAGGATWANVTFPMPSYNVPAETDATTFNGKLFWSCKSNLDILLVWDGTSFRGAGLAASAAAPTVANTGAGAYAAVARYYRTRWLHLSGSTVIRKGEPSPTSTVFTPSGAGTAARVTRPTAPSDGETHWIVEASTDAVNFFELSQIVIATTTYDDSAATTTYVNNPLSAALGTFTRLPAGKFLLTDDNRLFVGGTWFESTDRIYLTPVLGDRDQGDDERYVNTLTQKNYISFTTKNGGRLTGMGGPVTNGFLYAFKRKQIYRLTPTGESTRPFLTRCVSYTVGCLRHRTIVLAEDSDGSPALYFLSHRGPYRIGVNGLEYLGRDIEDLWYGLNGQTAVNRSATVFGHGVWHEDLGQVWWYVATGSANVPSLRLVLDVKQAIRKDRYGVRGGWVRHNGSAATTDARCSVMFANTVGAAMSTDLKPHVGLHTTALILKCDTADLTDNGTAFQGVVTSKSLLSNNLLGQRAGVHETRLVAKASSGVTITQTINRDFGAELQTSTVLLTLTASEGTATRVLRKFESSAQSEIGVLQLSLGDASAAAAAWSLDELQVTLEDQGTT